MGSVTTIVSKGGGNDFHGDLFDYIRNSAMDSRSFFDSPPSLLGRRIPLYQRNQFGGSFGGPIKKDKTFFYGAYEELKDDLNATERETVPPAACHTPVTSGVQSVDNQACLGSKTAGTTNVNPVIQPLLALFPSPNLPGNIYSWNFHQKTNEYYGQMRVDQVFSASDSFFARYTGDYEDQPNPGNYPTIGISWDSKSNYSTVSENHIFSPALLNQARASYSRTGIVYGYSTSLVGPQYSFNPGYGVGGISITGISGYNPPSPPFWNDQNIYTLSDDVFWTKGRHSLKIGTLLNEYNIALETFYNTLGSISFQNLTGFVAGTPSSYTLSAVNAGIGQNRNYFYKTAGFYIQDDFRVTSRLTLNLGVRYEFFTTPHDSNGRDYAFRNIVADTRSTVVHGPDIENPSYKNFSPRIGFAWNVTGKGTTSIRGGGGIYYDIGTIQSAFQWSENAMPPIGGLNSLACTPVCSSPISLPLAFPAGSLSSTAFLVDYYMKQPYIIQWNVSAEHRFRGDFVLSASYIRTRGNHLWQSKQLNPVLPTSVTNGVPFWDPSVLAGPEAAGCTSIVPTCQAEFQLRIDDRHHDAGPVLLSGISDYASQKPQSWAAVSG